eukprot:474159_1
MAAWSVTILFMQVVAIIATDLAPPVWPNAFTVSGTASWLNNGRMEGTCNLTQYYDYTNKRMRYDRGVGQDDYFCHMNENQKIACSLYFDSSGAMFVSYPSKNYCCQLCAVGEYCSVLKPTWLQNGKYDGQQTIGSRKCNVWNEQGAFTMDYWSQDDNNVPCAYWEEGNKSLQENNYTASSYVVGEPDPRLFDLPSQSCHNVCPKTWNGSGK